MGRTLGAGARRFLTQIKSAAPKVHKVGTLEMRLSTFTDYSLRVLIYLAQAPERRTTIAEIARAFCVSEHPLVKVVHFLGREGLLVNTRGRRGGVRLARAPDEINVAAAVRLAERGDLPAECFHAESNTCLLAGGCRLQEVLHDALGAFYATLGRYSLADLHVAAQKQRALFELRPAA